MYLWQENYERESNFGLDKLTHHSLSGGNSPLTEKNKRKWNGSVGRY